MRVLWYVLQSWIVHKSGILSRGLHMQQRNLRCVVCMFGMGGRKGNQGFTSSMVGCWEQCGYTFSVDHSHAAPSMPCQYEWHPCTPLGRLLQPHCVASHMASNAWSWLYSWVGFLCCLCLAGAPGTPCSTVQHVLCYLVITHWWAGLAVVYFLHPCISQCLRSEISGFGDPFLGGFWGMGVLTEHRLLHY